MNVPHTKPEIFILESLSMEDEKADRRDGYVLYQVLKMYNKSPIYYYFRTEKELVALAEEFARSKYRYLHFSSHGSECAIHTAFDTISYPRFAQIFEKKLNNKRLFVSACEVGNDLFATCIAGTNPGVYSILGPSERIEFNRSVAFWSSFYFLMFDYDAKEMKLKPLKENIEASAKLFDTNFHLVWHATELKKFCSADYTSDGIETNNVPDVVKSNQLAINVEFNTTNDGEDLITNAPECVM
jgi:hypothetical protein